MPRIVKTSHDLSSCIDISLLVETISIFQILYIMYIRPAEQGRINNYLQKL